MQLGHKSSACFGFWFWNRCFRCLTLRAHERSPNASYVDMIKKMESSLSRFENPKDKDLHGIHWPSLDQLILQHFSWFFAGAGSSAKWRGQGNCCPLIISNYYLKPYRACIAMWLKTVSESCDCYLNAHKLSAYSHCICNSGNGLYAGFGLFRNVPFITFYSRSYKKIYSTKSILNLNRSIDRTYIRLEFAFC